MADKKITQLTNITGANLVDADEFVVVDISADETKAITLGELKEAFDSGSGFVRITGDTMTGDLALSGADVTFGDNDKAIFGAGSDLQIYHDGGNSYVSEVGTGDLRLGAANIRIGDNISGASYIYATQNAEVTLYHNNSPKLATTSTGIDVTGNVTMATGGSIVAGGVNDLVLNAGESGTPDIYLQSGSSTKVKIEGSNGNVGIGTSSPSAKLDLQGTAAGNEMLEITHSGASQPWKFISGENGVTNEAFIIDRGASGEWLRFHAGAGTVFSYDNTERMRIDSSGNVGIGTSSPSAKLDINQSSAATGLEVYVNDTGSSKIADFKGYDNTLGVVSRMAVQANGNVGIGTSSPTGKLSVSDPTYLSSAATLGSSITLNSENTASWLGTRELISFESVGNGADHRTGTLSIKLKKGNSDTTLTEYMQINSVLNYITLSTAASEAMRIDSSGNVGIGTSSPSTKLQSKGGSITTLTDNAGLIANASASFVVDHGNNYGLYTGYIAAAGDAIGIAATRTLGSALPLSLQPFGGNVGIGTSSPATQASVQNASTSLGLEIDTTSGFASGPTLRGYYRSGSAYKPIAMTGSSVHFGINDVEKMRIDSSGNVGIGTSSPATPLHIKDSDGGLVQTIEAGNGGAAYTKYINSTTGSGFYTDGLLVGIDTDESATFWQYEASHMKFGTSGSERMRIDASGNLLVGKTSATTFNTEGIELRANDIIWATRTSAPSVELNRLTTDGDIAVFYKDGSTVGSIGVVSGDVYIQGPTNHSGIQFNTNGILPLRNGAIIDNTLDLGGASYRWDDIYATNGTIQTSDQNEKQDIAELSDAEQRVAVAAKGLLRKFRWRDAVAEKGDEARTHFGIIAQDLQAAFAAEGLDAGDYAMFISSTWTDEETGEERTRMGVRYSELLAFIIAAI